MTHTSPHSFCFTLPYADPVAHLHPSCTYCLCLLQPNQTQSNPANKPNPATAQKPACRYYKDWIIDNDITFGAINSKHGVIEFVSQGENPVGLAAPALAVRGGSMLITYSYSGPFNVPSSNGGIRAYPGAPEWWPGNWLSGWHCCSCLHKEQPGVISHPQKHRAWCSIWYTAAILHPTACRLCHRLPVLPALTRPFPSLPRLCAGVAYSVIDVNAPSMSGGSFNLAQAGAGCVAQYGNTRWGSYSGADIHFPSYKIWTAVEYAYQVADRTSSASNAGTNINVFT